MLLINKKLKYIYINYNFFTLQPKTTTILNNLKKKQSIVSLRAPRNFNIGKYKVYNLNNKLKLKFYVQKVYSHLFNFTNINLLNFYKLHKHLNLFKLNKVKSISFLIKTTIKFIWLL